MLCPKCGFYNPFDGKYYVAPCFLLGHHGQCTCTLETHVNKLKYTRAYLAGPIDYCEDDGIPWRNEMTEFLNEYGVVVINPVKKPIQICGVPSEIGTEKVYTKQLRADGKFDELRTRVKVIRSIDLRMTDIADFLIVHLDLNIPMCGTWEELFNANRQKKPILVVVEGGPTKAPLWLHGTIDWQYIFGSLNECKEYLKKLSAGEIEMGERWKLLDHTIWTNDLNLVFKGE